MKTILSALLILHLLCCLIAWIMIRLTFTRDTKEPKPKEKPSPDDLIYMEAAKESLRGKKRFLSLPHEDLSIKSEDGLTLRGRFLRNGNSENTILCVHGYKVRDGLDDFGCQMDMLQESGYNLLVVDDRAHGRSEGKYIGFSILDSRDCLRWTQYLAERFPKGQIILYGISMGAATVELTSSLSELPEQVCGVLGDCGFSSADEEIRTQIKELYHLPSFLVSYANSLLSSIAGYSLKDKEVRKEIPKTKIPLLIIHGGDDTFVKTKMAIEIYEAAKCDKKCLIVDHAIHAQSYRTDPETYKEAFHDLLKRAQKYKNAIS